MHAVALAPFPPFAGGAGAGFQWSMVTENAEALFPDFHEIVFVDIALAILRTDAGAAGYVAVYTYRGDAEAGLAGEKMVTDLAFVASEEALAAKTGVD